MEKENFNSASVEAIIINDNIIDLFTPELERTMRVFAKFVNFDLNDEFFTMEIIEDQNGNILADSDIIVKSTKQGYVDFGSHVFYIVTDQNLNQTDFPLGPYHMTLKSSKGEIFKKIPFVITNSNLTSIPFDLPNDPPQIEPIGELPSVLVNTEISFLVNVTDSDLNSKNQTLTFSLISPPTGATIDPETGFFSWIPSEADVGNNAFSINVTDGIDSDQENVAIMVLLPPPEIISLTASDPDGSDSVFSDGDVIIVKFSEPTNTPNLDSKEKLLSLFDLIPEDTSLGNDFTGTFIDASTLHITIKNSTIEFGNPPELGLFKIQAKSDEIQLLNSGLSSFPSTSISPSLKGDFGSLAGPEISALVANDPDDSDDVLSSGDTITVRFSEPTNTPDPTPEVVGLSNEDLTDLFAGVENFGASLNGNYSNPSTLIITILDPAGSDAEIGVLQVSVKESANLKNSAETSQNSVSVSPPLSGSFGSFEESVPVLKGGKAGAVVPSGIFVNLDLPEDEEGVVIFTEEKTEEEETESDGTLIGFAGGAVDVGLGEGASCEDGCVISFTLDKYDLLSLGIENISEISIFHDQNEDGFLDVISEKVETTVEPNSPNSILSHPDGTKFTISAEVTFNSKFAVGGIKALALGALAVSLGGGTSLTVPSFEDVTLINLGNPDDGFGGIISEIDLSSVNQTQVIKTGDDVSLRIDYHEGDGINDIHEVWLYFDYQGGHKMIPFNEIPTSIKFQKDDPLNVQDPNDLIQNANFTILEQGPTDFVLRFDLTFDKPMDKSNIALRSVDLTKNEISVEYQDVIMVQENSAIGKSEIPQWVKSNAGWWAEQMITDDDFTKGIQYLIETNLITVERLPPSENQDNSIPDWIRNNAGWWSNGLITDSDFLSGIEVMIQKGIIRI